MLTYSVKLNFASQEEKSRMIKTLEGQRFAFNEASKIKFEKKLKNSIVDLHREFYKQFREKYENYSLADITIQAEQECLSCYRSIKSNKRRLSEPVEKKSLLCRLNKKLYVYDFKNNQIKLTCFGGKRIWAKFQIYDKFNEFLSKYPVCDPLIRERDGEIWLDITFKNPEMGLISPEKAIGIDLGIKRVAATSEGKIFVDKKYLKEKRKLRYLKRQLQGVITAKKSKSAKRHLKKLKRKEANKTKNFIHHLTNTILDTTANVIVIEDLSQIKAKKGKKKYQNLNKISQVPFFKIKQFLTYKAPLYGKRVEVVCPSYTSQIDFRTGIKDGKRQGCRYYGKDGVVLDAELNAANNIAMRSKLPISSLALCQGLDGQALVTVPNVGNTLGRKT